MARQTAKTPKTSTLSSNPVPENAKQVKGTVVAREKPVVKTAKAAPAKAAPAKAAPSKADIKAKEKRVAELRKMALQTQKDYDAEVKRIRSERDKKEADASKPVGLLDKELEKLNSEFNKAKDKLGKQHAKAVSAAAKVVAKARKDADSALKKLTTKKEADDKKLASDLTKAEKELAAVTTQ